MNNDTTTIVPFFDQFIFEGLYFPWIHSYMVINLLLETDPAADPLEITNRTLPLLDDLTVTYFLYADRMQAIVDFLTANGMSIDVANYENLYAEALHFFVTCSECEQYYQLDNSSQTCKACPPG